MRFKRLLALLLAAALALSLLAGCGGGKNQSLAQIILNLLDDQYTNVTVEIDPDLEAALRQAVSEAETEDEIRAALEEILGPGISFRLLGDGQKGDTAWNLILYPGNDPDAAGRSAFAEWNKVFAFLPKDGQYGTKIAMIETENGYAILVRATVEKAGSRDDDDDDGPGYEKTGTTYQVYNSTGLNNVLFSKTDDATLNEDRNSGFDGITIELVGTSYSVSSTFGSKSEPFLGTLKSAGSDRAAITLTGGKGLFAQIGEGSVTAESNGKVENIDFHVQGTISDTSTFTIPIGSVELIVYVTGAVAGYNNGTITGCTVTGGTITSTDLAGGIVGYNKGTITSCTVTGGTITSTDSAGGLVGYNSGTIDGRCTVENTSVTATSSTESTSAHAGGLVGYIAGDSAEVTGTYSGSGTITATAEGGTSSAYAGGLAGENSGSGSVAGTYSGTGTITATGTISAYAGGLVGYNLADANKVTATYSGTGRITAKAKKNDSEYYTASVPTTNGAGTDQKSDGSIIHASAGTKWGSDMYGKPSACDPNP